MEIKDYLRFVRRSAYARAIRRRLWIVLIVPLAAALAAAGLSMRQEYRSVATIVIPQPRTVTVDVFQLLSNFQAALTSKLVIQQTASETGEGQEAIQAGLSAQQLGTSSVVEVTYTGEDAGTVQEVAEASSRIALRILASSGILPAKAEVEAAEATFQAAQAQIREFLQERGLAIPAEQYQIASNQLATLQTQLLQAKREANETAVLQLKEQIAGLKVRLTRLSEEVIGFQRLEAEQQRALTALSFADNRYLAAKGDVEAVAQMRIRATEAAGVPRLPTMIRSFVAAAAIGLILAIGIVVLLELLRPSTRRRAEDGSSEPLDGKADSALDRTPIPASH